MHLSEKLSILSRRLNLTQEELGDRLGIAHTTVGRWLRGKSRPYDRHLHKFAEVFGVPVEVLKDDSRDLPEPPGEATVAAPAISPASPGRHMAAFRATMPPDTKFGALTKEQRAQMTQAVLLDYAEQHPEIVQSLGASVRQGLAAVGNVGPLIASMQQQIANLSEQLAVLRSSIDPDAEHAAADRDLQKAKAEGKFKDPAPPGQKHRPA